MRITNLKLEPAYYTNAKQLLVLMFGGVGFVSLHEHYAPLNLNGSSGVNDPDQYTRIWSYDHRVVIKYSVTYSPDAPLSPDSESTVEVYEVKSIQAALSLAATLMNGINQVEWRSV